jgi:hypothetical protein
MALDLKADHLRNGSWLRDNALTQAATHHYAVNLVRQGYFEQFGSLAYDEKCRD